MYKILLIETGEYLYKARENSYIYSNYECALYPGFHFKHIEFCSAAGAEVYLASVWTAIQLETNLTVSGKELRNLVEIVEV